MLNIVPDLMPFIATALLGGLLGLLATPHARHHTGRSVAETEDDTHIFTFRNENLISTSQAARAALSLDDLDGDVYHHLVARLSLIFPSLPDRLKAAKFAGTGFTLHELGAEGAISLDVGFDDAGETLAVKGLVAPMARKMLVDQDRIKADDLELTSLRGTLDATPIPMWRDDAGGTIEWVNAAYLRLVEDAGMSGGAASWPPPCLFRRPTSAAPNDVGHGRSHLDMGDGRTDWFEITSKPVMSGHLHCAVPASATVRAETHLRNFTQTLTQTFAHVPIGLAIFDRRRQLAMFNPALVTMTSLDPAWLAAKPTLFDMLNKMRESRMVPERKDFSNWRSKLSELEMLAVEGGYCETWSLPSGQTYKVTGRPHPEGALAFLFEDISAEITLTRQFRNEIELNQSIFENLPEAIAIFSHSGRLEMSNRAYRYLWDMEPDSPTDTLTFLDAVQKWQSSCSPTPIWGDLRDFISHCAERSEWFASVDRLSGQELNCHFAPLAGGATLVSFSATMRNRPAPSPIRELSALTG